MQRRAFLTTGAALLAGCGGQSGTSSPDVPKPTAGRRATETEGTPFEPTVEFPTCRSFTIRAENYGPVLALLSDESVTEFDGQYSGEETFEASLPVEEVSIYAPDARVSAFNPEYEECVATETIETTDE